MKFIICAKFYDIFVLLPQITYVIAQMGKDTRIMGCRCVLFLEYSSQII